jgi:hypothetical protein
MSDTVLHSQAGAARALGIYRTTVADLARAWNIHPKPISTNGFAKGLDDSDLRVLRRALNMAEVEPAEPTKK